MINLFKIIGQVAGVTSKLAERSKGYLNKKIVNELNRGYRSVKKQYCQWCKRQLPLDKLEGIPDKKYLLCHKCIVSTSLLEVELMEKSMSGLGREYLNIIRSIVFNSTDTPEQLAYIDWYDVVQEANKKFASHKFEQE